MDAAAENEEESLCVSGCSLGKLPGKGLDVVLGVSFGRWRTGAGLTLSAKTLEYIVK